MSNLVLLALKLGFLAALWLFVLLAIVVIRRDILGARAGNRPGTPGGRRSREERRRARQERQQAARYLLVTSGSRAGSRVPLASDPISIGRAEDCTLVLGDDFVSSRHARLMPRNGSWLVEDLGSTNGTYLGQQRINRATPVGVGTPIRVGKTVLELRR
jgi:hypothetical protein